VHVVGVSINDIRGEAADATLQNLLGVLSAKLDMCARLPVFAFEAGNAGHESCATAFRELAAVERRSFEELLACLKAHLESDCPEYSHGHSEARAEGRLP
jgi:hypothetical protein